MDSDMVVQIGRQALLMTAMAAAPLLLAALVTGLAVGLIQAATQINEQTLSFIPKLLAMALTLALLGPWLLSIMQDYTIELIVEVIPRVVSG